MKKIMVVDDSTAIRNIISTALVNNYEITESENGKVAFEKAKTNQYDLFLLDVNMPEMDGISLVKELRKMPQYQKTPVIMLTTESRDDKKQQGKEAGANGWILKPCEPDKLIAVIQKMI